MDKSLAEKQALIREKFGDEVSAGVSFQRPPTPDKDRDEDDSTIARVCYFYPQYDIEAAEQLSASQIRVLLHEAERQRAIELLNHTLISAAPHTKKGSLVKELIKQYKEVIGS